MRSFTITPSPIQGERWHTIILTDDGMSVHTGPGWQDRIPEPTKETPESLVARGYIEE